MSEKKSNSRGGPWRPKILRGKLNVAENKQVKENLGGETPKAQPSLSENGLVGGVKEVSEGENPIVPPTEATQTQQEGEVKIKRQDDSTLNPEAPEFVPNISKCQRDDDPALPLSEKDITSNEKNVNNDRKQEFISDLTETMLFCYTKVKENPAAYDDLMEVMTPYFKTYLEHGNSKDEIAKQLVDLALQDATFAYHAVRMTVVMLDIDNTKNDDSFRSALLTVTFDRVNNMYQNVFHNKNTDQNAVNERVKPLLMFLAELYLQLLVGGERFQPVGLEVLHMCIELKDADNLPLRDRLETIVAVMKLAGMYLDKENSTEMNILMGPLWILADRERSNIGEHTFNMVNNLTELRYTHRWGTATSAPSPPSPHVNQSTPNQDEGPIFYGPDGRIIDQEQQRFLESEARQISPDSERNPSTPLGSIEDEVTEFEVENAHVSYIKSLTQVTHSTMKYTSIAANVREVSTVQTHQSMQNNTLAMPPGFQPSFSQAHQPMRQTRPSVPPGFENNRVPEDMRQHAQVHCENVRAATQSMWQNRKARFENAQAATQSMRQHSQAHVQVAAQSMRQHSQVQYENVQVAVQPMSPNAQALHPNCENDQPIMRQIAQTLPTGFENNRVPQLMKQNTPATPLGCECSQPMFQNAQAIPPPGYEGSRVNEPMWQNAEARPPGFYVNSPRPRPMRQTPPRGFMYNHQQALTWRYQGPSQGPSGDNQNTQPKF